MASIKEQLHQQCKVLIEQKTSALQQELKALSDSAEADTKSSMGDKYETGREMINLEKGKIGEQLRNAETMLQAINAIDPTHLMQEAALGAVVQTNVGRYFLSAPLGQVKLNKEGYFCISMGSPIGRQLAGLKVGDTFEMAGKIQEIESVD